MALAVHNPTGSHAGYNQVHWHDHPVSRSLHQRCHGSVLPAVALEGLRCITSVNTGELLVCLHTVISVPPLSPGLTPCCVAQSREGTHNLWGDPILSHVKVQHSPVPPHLPCPFFQVGHNCMATSVHRCNLGSNEHHYQGV